MTLAGVAHAAPTTLLPICYTEQVQPTKPIMTQQQLLQNARNVIIGMTDAQRQCLKTAAIAKGRTAQQVSKAGTMRLALWVSKGTSAI